MEVGACHDVLKYVAKFTVLARFRDDYVATNIAKVRKFEDGSKEKSRKNEVMTCGNLVSELR